MTDDQSSQVTLGTSDSTIASPSEYTLLYTAKSTDDTATNDAPEAARDSNQDDDDPLQVRELALSFDYLMYKIQDHTAALSEAVAQNVDYQKKQSEDTVARVNDHIKKAKLLVQQCQEMDAEIDKLEQLQLMTRDFKDRLSDVDHRLKVHNKRFSR